MAQTFITIGCVTAFFILKDPPPSLAPLVRRMPPGGFVLGMVVAAYPVWGILGIALAFLFLALQNGYPGAGLGSANLVYTLGVAAASALVAAPVAALARRFWPGVALMTLASALIFGWLLPFLAT